MSSPTNDYLTRALVSAGAGTHDFGCAIVLRLSLAERDAYDAKLESNLLALQVSLAANGWDAHISDSCGTISGVMVTMLRA